MDKERTALEQEGQLAAQSEKLQESQAALDGAMKQRASLISETRRTVMDNQHEADQKVTTNAQELIKAQLRHKLMKLVAPVDGSVQQLVVHTVGGVVTPAQVLMVVVPKDHPLEVEAFVENKDIGFVNAGQEAEIKIETFPYTKHGTIHGEVKHVSMDAIDDEKRGLVYSSRVKMEKATIQVENKVVNLGPGMAVTVEIKTGMRRVIRFPDPTDAAFQRKFAGKVELSIFNAGAWRPPTGVSMVSSNLLSGLAICILALLLPYTQLESWAGEEDHARENGQICRRRGARCLASPNNQIPPK